MLVFYKYTGVYISIKKQGSYVYSNIKTFFLFLYITTLSKNYNYF